MPDGSLAAPLASVTAFRKYFVLTNAMGTTAQVVSATPCALGSLVNQSAAAQGNTITLFDAIAGDSLNAGNTLAVITLGVVPYVLNFQTIRGLTMQANVAAVTVGVLITIN